MVLLTAYATLLPAKISEALKACHTVRGHSTQEPGCERYDFFQSPDDPTRIVFVEEWTSRAHLDDHFGRTAFKEFFAAMGECLQVPPEIRIFEAQLQE